jgi:hypothetical protein
MDTIGPEAIKQAAAASDLHGKYAETIDRESAYEKLSAKVVAQAEEHEPAEARGEERRDPGLVEKVLGNSAVKSFLRSAAGALGREITRGLFGTARKRR